MAMPEISVIIPAYHSGATIQACLEALAGQTFRDFEVILIDSTPRRSSVAEVAGRYPFVNHHHHPERLLPHQARNLGIQRARGRILVFTDPDCLAASHWLETLLAAHRAGRPVVGGAVGAAPGFWNLAVHLTKFGWWMPAGAAGPRTEIPSANASHERTVLERAGAFLGAFFSADSELSWRVRGLGFPIWFEPRAVVIHQHLAGLREFLKERFLRGRDFGAARTELFRWTRRRCLVYLLLLPVLPLVMAVRALRFAWAGGYLGAWLATSPIQWAGHCMWCLGEVSVHWRRLCKR
jgi:GT2 family glycosyltransferase